MKLSSHLSPVKKSTRKATASHRASSGTTVTVDVSTQAASLSHRSVTVDKGKGHQVTWVCNGGRIRIVWEDPRAHAARDPNPFEGTPFEGPPKQKIESGKVKGGRGMYKYTLYVYPDNPAGELLTIDPQVDVIDTGVTPAQDVE